MKCSWKCGRTQFHLKQGFTEHVSTILIIPDNLGKIWKHVLEFLVGVLGSCIDLSQDGLEVRMGKETLCQLKYQTGLSHMHWMAPLCSEKASVVKIPTTSFQTALVRGHPLVPGCASVPGLQCPIDGLYRQVCELR